MGVEQGQPRAQVLEEAGPLNGNWGLGGTQLMPAV